MQLKVLATAIIISVSALPASAQHKNAGSSKKSGSDTASVTKAHGIKPSGNLLAANTPDQVQGSKEKGYGHVPLAGEKAYFGKMNDYVNDYVRKYLEVHNRTLGSVQSNSATPFSVIDNVLEEKNLPKELKYLAVIESALNHNAVSPAGAVGPWQLMETTARMMGLTVSRKNDDRRDWNKSTTAATKYLELLYSQLNDWLLVIAAYNSGPTPVLKAIQKTGSHNFWDIKEMLPRETQGHVLAFIATASIFENLSKFISLGSIPLDFKFGKEKDEEPNEKPAIATTAPKTTVTTALPKVAGTVNTPKLSQFTTAASTPASTPVTTVAQPRKPQFTEDELKSMYIVKLNAPISTDLIVQEVGIDRKLFTKWNPDYDLFMYKKYPSSTYDLRLPKDKTDLFLTKKDALIKKSKAFMN